MIYDIFDIYLRVQGKTAPLQELPLGLAEVDNRAVDEDPPVLFVPLDRVNLVVWVEAVFTVECHTLAKHHMRWKVQVIYSETQSQFDQKHK